MFKELFQEADTQLESMHNNTMVLKTIMVGVKVDMVS
jgi:hypothetical protein